MSSGNTGMRDDDAGPEQLDLFGDEEAHQRELDEIYESLANPPDTFLRLVGVMTDWEKRQARNEDTRRRRQARRNPPKPPRSPKDQVK